MIHILDNSLYLILFLLFQLFYYNLFLLTCHYKGATKNLIKGMTIDNQQLPKELKNYYLQIGGMAFNSVHNKLVNPQNFKVIDNKLIFLHENQQVCIWAVPLNKEDNPIVQ